MATSWPRTRAQWRRGQLGGCVSHSFAQRCGVAEARRIPFPGHSPLCPKCHSISRDTHGKVVWTRESSYANPCTDFVLRSGCNNHPRGRGGPVFLLLGFPSAAAMVFGLDGAPADPILALARAATTLTQTAREKPRKPPIQRQLFPAISHLRPECHAPECLARTFAPAGRRAERISAC